MHGYFKIIESIHLSQTVPQYLISMFKIRGLNAKKICFLFFVCRAFIVHLVFKSKFHIFERYNIEFIFFIGVFFSFN
jgi:hypothetical protein